jgi:hypothetical protein
MFKLGADTKQGEKSRQERILDGMQMVKCRWSSVIFRLN